MRDGSRRRGPLADRLWSKVQKTDGCWLWTGYVMSDSGHGQIQRGRRGEGAARVHIVAWELLVGPVPAGMILHHHCETKHCVNPAHLGLTTRSEHPRIHAEMRGVGLQATCRRGHTFDYVNSRGERVCRTCQRARNRRYRERTCT